MRAIEHEKDSDHVCFCPYLSEHLMLNSEMKFD